MYKNPGIASRWPSSCTPARLTINFRGLPVAINTIHVVLHYEVAVNVSAAGIEVLD